MLLSPSQEKNGDEEYENDHKGRSETLNEPGPAISEVKHRRLPVPLSRIERSRLGDVWRIRAFTDTTWGVDCAGAGAHGSIRATGTT
jgi:hypothetical protein